MRASITVDGVTSRGDVHLSDNGIYFANVPQANDSKEVERLEQAMRAQGAKPGSDIEWSFTPDVRFSPERSRLSWIRSSYLVAFAAFGWRYVLQTSFNPIRAQLLDPQN
ncbi:MAG: hypothetical protein ABWY11_03240, partial [Umezawaea sp.]